MEKLYTAGFQNMLVGTVGENNTSFGTQKTLTNGTGSGAYYVSDPVDAPLALAALNIIDVAGGDVSSLAKFSFGSRNLESFDATVASVDEALISLISDTNVSNALSSRMALSGTDPQGLPRVKLWFMFTQKAQLKGGCNGEFRYRSIIVMCSDASTAYGALAQGTSNPMSITIIPSPSLKFINGMTFDDTASSGFDMNFTGDEADHVGMSSYAPLHVYTYRADAAETSFTLPYKPLSDVVTLGSSDNAMTIDGVPTAPTTVDTSTGVVTFPAATGGELYVMIYTTAFKATA